MKRKNFIRGFHTIIIVVGLLTGLLICKGIINLFLVQRFHIPTSSMSPVILPGDRVLVNKILGGSNVKFNGHKYHLPGIRKFRNGDILVFEFPYDKTLNRMNDEPDMFYCKRCLGVPGDTVSIVNGYFQNTNNHGFSGNLRNQRILSNYATLHMSDSVLNAFPFAGNEWTIKDLGPLYVPKSNDVWYPDSISFPIYKLIIDHETADDSKFENNRLIIGKDSVDCYQFKQNYYFCCGDNVLQSYDSRYWGFVPENFIIGVTTRVFFNYNKNKPYPKINRIFKKIK